MKNIVPTVLSIIIGFSISLFALNSYSSESLKTNDTKTAKKTEVKKKTKASSKKKSEKRSESKTPKETNLSDIQGSFENWNKYTKENIDLMSTFVPVDDKGVKTDKGIFLSLLRTGAFIPVKDVVKGETQYKLINLEQSADEKIKKGITGKATIAYQYFRREGKKLPSYDFVDLKGKSHNKADTEGKILVLKCWFINCKICVEEFPELNALVDKYKDDNIEFVSLAFDKKDKLVDFLKTKSFKFSTVPEQKDYMSKKLKVKQYPTHLIVDSNGVILKMVNNVKTLTSELDRIMKKQ
ncbi:TlpA disulfide reductase family protein [uncultured Tenacibaculum sp.]|uniref:TlpA family protein disulfide reductase n=1 Tax=uncultured Tenacibaculum sp. TaxID=174713 RepID=UPI0026058700|nr:TlpA disulfide reductase family protein [uncultured Tenacibaculum sp.]